MKGMNEAPKPVVLVVLDGFGVSLQERGNAIFAAHTPNLDAIEKKYPFTTLQASGVAVGLPWGEAGNSEVGHLTMGAGRVIYHHLPRIITSIHDGSFYTNPAFVHAAEHVNANKSALHLLGLVSSGSVHSYIDHLYALLEFAKRHGVSKVFLHVITDGKDAPPQEAAKFLQQLRDRLAAKHPNVIIASLVGRFFCMDRDERWERVRRAYELFTQAAGAPFQNPTAYLEESYAQGVFDESIEPAFFGAQDAAQGRIAAGDALIIFNFREDSMREITEAFAKEAFDHFPRAQIQNLKVVTMTEYEKSLENVEAAFPPLEIAWPLARALSQAGKIQLHIAETEKYAHVTYFFNGGIEKPFPDEDRMLVQSLPVPHFDEEPKMKAPEITAKIIEHLDDYDFIIANLANADMVGHTGKFEAAISAVEALDQAIGQIKTAVLAKGGILITTGDHGNAEQKIHPVSGEPITEHTINPVPFYLIGAEYELGEERTAEEIRAKKKETGGILTDIAPTILELMKIPKPPEMTGKSLLGILKWE